MLLLIYKHLIENMSLLDKASNKFAFICKKIYISKILPKVEE